jgi:hypothetical protein
MKLLKQATWFCTAFAIALGSGSFLYLATVPIVLVVFFLLGVSIGALLVLYCFRKQLLFDANSIQDYINQAVELALSRLNPTVPQPPKFQTFTEEADSTTSDMFCIRPKPSLTRRWPKAFVVHVLDNTRKVRYISSISSQQIQYTSHLDQALHFRELDMALRASMFCWLSNFGGVYVRVFNESDLISNAQKTVDASVS